MNNDLQPIDEKCQIFAEVPHPVAGDNICSALLYTVITDWNKREGI